MQIDFFSRVKDPRGLGKVKHDHMQVSLRHCREQIMSSLNGCNVTIDGKKLRGETSKSRGCAGLCILNVIISEYEICITEERMFDSTSPVDEFKSE